MRQITLPFFRLIAHLFCLLLFYFIFRLGFLFFHFSSFVGLHWQTVIHLLFQGLRFDISAILAVNCLFIFLFILPFNTFAFTAYQQSLRFVFVFTNAVAFLFEIGDWMYFPFNHKRSTAEVLSMLSRKGDFLFILPSFLKDYWYAFLIAAFFIFLLVKSYRKIEMHFKARERLIVLVDKSPELRNKFLKLSLRLVIFLTVVGACVVGIRGGLQLVPINIRNALEATKSEYAPIVLNTPFSIINSFSSTHLEIKNFMSDEEANALVRPIKQFANDRPFKQMNVVLIILESFSKEFTKLGPGRSYTPFLDSLMGEGLTFTNAFANSLHSISGIPAIIAGIPSLMDEALPISVYSTNKITTLPAVLKPLGYNSAFFHGATNGSMSIDIFAESAGFDRYFGRSEYNNEADYDGAWGIFDEPFLQYFAEKMRQQQQPFCNAVFTVTSHPPYGIPRKYEGKFPEGDLPVQTAIAYTDYALGRFFNHIKNESWFENTLFVITPDHCSPMASNAYYSVGTGRYQIPVIFYAPGDPDLKGYNNNLMQQIDILPSILDFLNYKKPFFALGNSIFEEGRPRFVINYLAGVFNWIHAGYQTIIFDDKPREAYAFPQDSLKESNLLNVAGFEMDTASFRLWQALVQTYTNALIRNEMTFPQNSSP